MHYRYTLALLLLAVLVSGCVWTAPGPTSTPWPTSAPTLTHTPGPIPTPEPTHTPGPSNTEEESTVPPFPNMPANPVERNQMFQAPPPMIIDTSKTYRATIKTAKGDIECELYADKAPQTVNNFVYLSRAGFYNGLTFHRVESGFVIQGGDPLGRGNGGPGYTIPAEIGLPHLKGALATARLSDQANPKRESSGSQFYITLNATPHLDGGYTVFGQVIEGTSIVEGIAIGDLIQEIVITEE